MKKMKYMSAIALTAFLCASCDLDIFPQMGYNQGNVEDVVVNEDTGEVSQYKSRGDMESLRNSIYSSWLKGNVIQEGILLDGMVYAECRADNAYGGNPGTPELTLIPLLLKFKRTPGIIEMLLRKRKKVVLLVRRY